MKPIDLVLSTLLVVVVGSTSVRADIIPAEPQNVVLLDGTWRFKIEQASAPPTTAVAFRAKTSPQYDPPREPFYNPDYREGGDWHDIKVPSNWEMSGFSPATYHQPDNVAALYRVLFDVPADWDGRLVKLNFDGVQNAAEVWLNGQPVRVDESSWGRDNYHESGWTAWQADLTPAIKPGQKNLLALRVLKNSKSADLDSGDYFFLGGVYRSVILFSVPRTHVADLQIQTRLLPNDQAEVKAVISKTGSDASSVEIKLDGASLVRNTISESPVETVITQTIDKPKLWSAEHPNLYPLTIDLKDPAGKTIERITRRIGIREVTIKDGVFLLNGVPIKMAGMCRHDVWPDLGTALNPDAWRKDITLMKQANVNAIRTSHYPYGSEFYDLCDELGIYVADELPYCWAPTDDAELLPAFMQRARETIRRDKNHACVIIWAIGNENKKGQDLKPVADLVKRLDPARPRLVSCMPFDAYDTELSDSHYTQPPQMEAAAARADKNGHPHIYLENPNVWDARFGADYGCWDRWYHVLAREWAVVDREKSCPGTFIWEWQDRAVADKCATKLHHFDPDSGLSWLKMKGIVDAFRTPRPQYWNMKMIFAPIKVDPAIEASSSSVTLKINNRYSFTDLSVLSTNWTLLKSDQAIESGSAHLALAPLSEGDVKLDLPADPLAQADALRLDFGHPDGRTIASYQLPLKPQSPPPALNPLLPPGLNFPRLNLVTNITESDPIAWRRITRRSGHLDNIELTRAAGSKEPIDEAKLLAAPLTDGCAIDADVVWQDGTKLARVHAEYAKSRFVYRFDWTASNSPRDSARQPRRDKKAAATQESPGTDVQEIGWAFALPDRFDHFSWKRQAPLSVYPPDHIGRAAGAARPDSARVNPLRITRPDAFDFTSSKFDCDQASLTDAAGAGLLVLFAPDDRHQCKGGIAEGRGYELIVNKRVSVPSDISTGGVSDLYLRLSAGNRLEGSFAIGSR